MYSFSKIKNECEDSFFPIAMPESADYRVFINGETVPVYTCNISKYSFNTVWPGHQRTIDQREQASFINIVGDEDVNIEVEVLMDFEGEVRVKPYSKGINPIKNGNRYSFTIPADGHFVLQCGSYHRCLYIFGGKPVSCDNPDSVTYYFGPGIHFSGKITLNSNESVYVDKDAYVYGCIYADDTENIRIFGNGIFDDSTEERVSIHCYEPLCNGNIKLYNCKNVSVEGVGFTNSAIWCVNLFGCYDVTLDNIKVFGQWRYNNDGIDIVNSQNVTIKDSFIHSFDDTITIKGIDRFEHIDCKNIHTENCILWCDWGKACEIGIETACKEYENISFVNCDVLRGGDTVCDIQNGDTAEVHNIRFENINAEYNSFDTPMQYQENDEQVYTCQNEQFLPRLISVRNYAFHDLYTDEVWGIPTPTRGIDLKEFKSGSVHDISFKNINVFYDKDLYLVDGKSDIRVFVKKDRENTEYYNINIEDIKVNGEPFDFVIRDDV